MKIIRRRAGIRVEMLYGEAGNTDLKTTHGDFRERKGRKKTAKARRGDGAPSREVEKDVERLPIGQALHLGGDVRTQG